MGNMNNPITTEKALVGESTNESREKFRTPIEIALQIDENGMTTARKLYAFLELANGQFSRWARTNITENEFAEENVDYWGFDINVEGNITQDYRLTAHFAKKLSMQSHTERGEQARNYFIGCEQVLVRIAEERHKAEIEREKGIAVRQALTKAIEVSGENERMHNMAYTTYTDLVYRSLFGKSAKQFRDEFGISKTDNLRDLFSEEDLKKIQNAEMLISSLIGYGWGYYEIKDFLMDKSINRIMG